MPVSSCSAWTLPSPDFLRDHWLRGAGSAWTGQRHIHKVRGEPEPPGSFVWLSQINNVFRSCLHNYTGSFFQGSSRPPRSLIASASSSRPAPQSGPPSSLRLPWRRCPHGAGPRGRCQVEQQNRTAAPATPEVLGTDTLATGTGRSGRDDKAGDKPRWERETFRIGQCLWTWYTASTKIKRKNQVFEFILKKLYMHAYACVYIYRRSLICLFSTSGNSTPESSFSWKHQEAARGLWSTLSFYVSTCS